MHYRPHFNGRSLVTFPWTFAFYKKLEESEANCVYKDDNIVVLKRANGDYLGVAWNIARKSTEQGKEKMLLEFTFPAEQEEYCFLTKTVILGDRSVKRELKRRFHV